MTSTTNHHIPRSLPSASCSLGRFGLGCWLALVSSLGACVSSGADDDGHVGTLSVNLVGQAPSGAVYRLRDATITVTGPGSVKVFNTEDDPDRTSLSASVPTGSYSASLRDGWRIEHVEGLSSTTVAATLLSDNPSQFAVASEQRTTVPLRFRVTTEDIDLAQGYDIVLTTEEVAPHEIVVGELGGTPVRITMFPPSANGDVAPTRSIVGPATTLVFPRSVLVAGDQLIVADQLAAAIDFFPLSATGNVAPARRITNSSLVSPSGLAVVDNLLWVSQVNGTLAAFPITASGNVEPVSFTAGIAASPAIAFDHNELYVLGFQSHEIRVYSLATLVPTVTRIITDNSLTGVSDIAIAGDEIFVAQSVTNQIRVYPRAANGSVAPTRTIGGDKTHLSGLDQIAVFRNELYVGGDAVLVFPSSTNGNVAPTRSISGPHTNIGSPRSLTIH
jgi:hypothetical protein